MAVKKVSILGATGSVGRSTVDLILSSPEKFSVQAITCNENTELLAEQAIKLRARCAVTADPSKYEDLKNRLSGTDVKVMAGRDAVIKAASMQADWIMAAIVGMAGLEPIMAAIVQGTRVAIANKEPLVAAGPFVIEAARKSGAVLLPVDSEHNAVFQVFDRDRPQGITRIILTASGGPFRTWTHDQMACATPAQAVAHPNWSMGAKISVDSATMMNKALEVIEAHVLFGLPPEKIEVLIHPQSVVHSMVEYKDGSILSQMGAPDMRTPIAYTLAWPDRMDTAGAKLDLTKNMNLEFSPLDAARFPAVGLAYECIRSGLGACVAFNAANEVAVAAFLREEIGFTDIFDVVSSMVKEEKAKNSLILFPNEFRKRMWTIQDSSTRTKYRSFN